MAPERDRQLTVYRLLIGLMYSRRFDRPVLEADTDGQFTDPPRGGARDHRLGRRRRADVLARRASGGEDYKYDARADRYRAHDNTYDSLEEVKMVRGVSDGFMEAFAPHLTVYASDKDCKVNLGAISNKNGGDCTPLLMGIVRAAVIARSEQAADRSERPRRQPALSDRQRRLRSRVGGRLRQPATPSPA